MRGPVKDSARPRLQCNAFHLPSLSSYWLRMRRNTRAPFNVRNLPTSEKIRRTSRLPGSLQPDVFPLDYDSGRFTVSVIVSSRKLCAIQSNYPNGFAPLCQEVSDVFLFCCLSAPGVDAPESATFCEEASAIGVAFLYS